MKKIKKQSKSKSKSKSLNDKLSKIENTINEALMYLKWPPDIDQCAEEPHHIRHGSPTFYGLLEEMANTHDREKS